jgi:hypothetical protein
VVEESSSITFDSYLEITRPNLVKFENTLLDKGPIIDVFKVSGGGCVCDIYNGYFFTQIRYDAECSEYNLWIVFTDTCDEASLTNPDSWFEFQLTGCSLFNIQQSGAIAFKSTDTLKLIGLHLFSSLGLMNFDDFNNFNDKIVYEVLTSVTNSIYDYSGDSANMFFAGADGWIGLKQNLSNNIVTLSTVNTGNFYSIDSVGSFWIAAGENGAVETSSGLIPIFTTTETVSDTVNNIRILGDGVFLATTVTGDMYKTVNYGKRWKKITSFSGTVEKIYFVNEYLGYMAAVDSNGMRLYQTIDGGYNWSQIGDTYNRELQVLGINADTKGVTFTGRRTLLTLTDEELATPTTLLDTDDTGFIIATV